MPRKKEVEFDEEAIKETVRGLPSFKRFKSIVKSIRNDVDPAEALKTANTLFGNRKVRSLDPRNVTPKDMIEACAQELSHRSRMVKTRVDLMSKRMDLDKAIRATKRLIYAEIYELLPYRTKTERDGYIERFLRLGTDLFSEIEVAIKSIDYFIEDIDKGGFNTKHIIDSMSMIYQKERTI